MELVSTWECLPPLACQPQALRDMDRSYRVWSLNPMIHAGLWELFEPRLVVSAKEVAAGKPAPDVYVECLRRLGCLDPSRRASAPSP